MHNFGFSLILAAARENEFVGDDYKVPGARIAVMYDRQEIEYVLKDNWENFLKNEKKFSIQVAFEEMLGRGIFAVDGR